MLARLQDAHTAHRRSASCRCHSTPRWRTSARLGSASPAHFLTLFDHPPGAPVRILNADLSTVTGGADLVIGVGDPLTEIFHLDFQSGPNAKKGADVLV